MTQVPPSVPPDAQYPPVAPVTGSRAMAGAALGFGISALIPCLGVVTGIIGIILGIVALVKRKAGEAMAIVGLGAGVFGILVIQPVLVTILVPAVMAGLDASQKFVCRNNVGVIGSSIDRYRLDHNKYPADLAELISEGFIPGGTLRCPGASDDAAHSLALKDGGEISSNYFYLPPAADADPKTIVMCGYRGNHRNGRTVLYHDGSVELLEEGVFHSQLSLPQNAAFAEELREVEPPLAPRP